MKSLKIIIGFIITTNFCFAQAKPLSKNIVEISKPIKIVEAACGQCQFKMVGEGCDLAIKIKGKPYFVEGTSIDEHGDAHAEDGFCKKTRKAEVQGKVVKNRFVATYFKLL